MKIDFNFLINFFAKEPKFWQQKWFFFRKTTMLDAFYGKFEKPWWNRNCLRALLIPRANGKIDVQKNLIFDRMIFLPNMKHWPENSKCKLTTWFYNNLSTCSWNCVLFQRVNKLLCKNQPSTDQRRAKMCVNYQLITILLRIFFSEKKLSRGPLVLLRSISFFEIVIFFWTGILKKWSEN